MGKEGKSKKDKGAEKSKKEEKVEKTAKAPKQEKSDKPAKKQSSGDFTQKKYSGSIALTKLIHVVMKKKNKKGKEIVGLFIPVKENHLVEGKEGAWYMPLSVITKSPQDEHGQNGFIAQNGNKKWSEASDKEKEAFRALPILGNIKDFEDTQTASTDTSGSKGEIDEEDDLPF